MECYLQSNSDVYMADKIEIYSKPWYKCANKFSGEKSSTLHCMSVYISFLMLILIPL